MMYEKYSTSVISLQRFGTQYIKRECKNECRIFLFTFKLFGPPDTIFVPINVHAIITH